MGLQGSGLPQAAEDVLTRYGEIRRDRVLRSLYDRVLSTVYYPGWTTSYRVTRLNPQITPRLVKTGNTSLYFRDQFMTEGRNELSAYNSSEGTLYLLFISVLLLHRRTPKIFALDNVDNALNPALRSSCLGTLIKCVCGPDYRQQHIGPDQVFLTSDNPTAIDAFDIFDPDQQIFVVSRDQSGLTQVTRLQPPDGVSRAEWVKRSSGRKLSQLWIDGQIKGALGEQI